MKLRLRNIKKLLSQLPLPFWVSFYIFLLLITLPVLAYIGNFGNAAPGSLTVTIDQKSGTADPNPSYTSVFTVQFSEAIDSATFTNTDITLAGTAPGQQVQSITEAGSFNKTTYEVRIQATAAGTITPSIAQELITAENGANGTNQASSSTDNSVTYNGEWEPGEFIVRYTTTSPNTVITASAIGGYTYNYNLDCQNDGVLDYTGATNSRSCTYPVSGQYEMVISGAFPRTQMGSTSRQINVVQWGNIAFESFQGMFGQTTNIQISALDAPNMSNATSMNGMFADATNFNSNINHWDVSTITDMSELFIFASFYNQPLSDWDVGNVTNMARTFRGLHVFNQPLNSWDVSSVVDMTGMFENAWDFNQPLNNWNVSSVTTMDNMFYAAYDFNQSLNGWNVSSVTSMIDMFNAATSFNQSLNNWNVSNVTNMSGMFNGAAAFNQTINTWNTSLVVDMNSMFATATAFNQSLNNWNVSNVTNMSGMFYAATAFNEPLNNWNVGSVTSMDVMFAGATSFNQPLNNWNTSSVTSMNNMFFSASAFNRSLGAWNVSNVTSMQDMFGGAEFFGPDSKLSRNNYDSTLNGWAAQSLQSDVIFGAGDSVYCGAATSRQDIIDNYNWTITDGGLDCSFAAGGDPFIFRVDTARSIVEPDAFRLNGIDNTYTYNYSVDCNNDGIAELTNQTGQSICTYPSPGEYEIAITGQVPRLFFNAATYNNKIIDVLQWGDIEWRSMELMFENSPLQISATDAPDLTNVTSMEGMFSLSQVFNSDISHWDVSNITDMSDMFLGARAFNQPLDSWNTSNVTDMSFMFSEAFVFNQPLNSWNVSNVTDMSFMFFAYGSESAFNQPLDSWNTSNVTDMSFMLYAASFDQPLGGWDMSSVTQAEYMLRALSVENYDDTLIGWSGQILQSNVGFGADNSNYCLAEAERQQIIDTYNWTINDRGRSFECYTPGVPQNLSADPGVTSIELDWDDVVPEAGLIVRYTVEYKPSSSNDWWVYSAPYGSFLELTVLTPNTSYDLRVKASYEGLSQNDSEWSDVLTVSTLESGVAYDITDCEQLQAIAINPVTMEIGDATGNYRLMNDIDCSDTVNWRWGNNSGPAIGFLGIFNLTNGQPFTGSFDGQGYTVSNIYQRTDSFPYGGVFFATNGATLQNVTFNSMDRQVGGNESQILASQNVGDQIFPFGFIDPGALVSSAVNTTITNVHMKDLEMVGNSNSGTSAGLVRMGGFVGFAKDSTITRSSATGSINIAGYDWNDEVIEDEIRNIHRRVTDIAGNKYVADTNNNRIQKFDNDGNFLLEWGTAGSGDGQFNQPNSLSEDGEGNIYVADTNNNRIQKFDNDGNFLLEWGTAGSGDGQFNQPQFIVSTKGYIYGDPDEVYVFVIDASLNRVQVFDANGNFEFSTYRWDDNQIAKIFLVNSGGVSGFATVTEGTTIAQSYTDIDVDYNATLFPSGFQNDLVSGLVGYAKDTSINNSYSRGSITTTGGPIATGGIIAHGIQGNSLTKSYTITEFNQTENRDNPVQLIDEQSGGIVGIAHSDIVLQDVFDAGSIQSNIGASGLIGSIYQGNILPGTQGVVANNYYDSSKTSYADCAGSSLDLDNGAAGSSPEGVCEPVNQSSSQPSYFFNNKTNPPLNQWNFASIWKTTCQYPNFVGQTNCSPTNPTDPENPTDPTDPSNPTNPEDPSNPGGGGGTTTPTIPDSETDSSSNPAIPPATSDRPLTTNLFIQGASLGPLQRLVEAIPGSVARSIPWTLLLLLIALSLYYLYMAYLEEERRKALRNLIARFKSTQQARASYLDITSHYVNTPLSVMQGTVQVLASKKAINEELNMAATTQLDKLSKAVQSLLAQAQQTSTSQNAVATSLERTTITSIIGKPYVWVPLAVSYTLAVLANVIFIQADKYEASTINIAAQIGVAIVGLLAIVSSVYYWQRMKQAKRLMSDQVELEKQYAYQQSEFIGSAYEALSADLTALNVLGKTIVEHPQGKPFAEALTKLEQTLFKLETVGQLARNVPGQSWQTDVNQAIEAALTEARQTADAKQVSITTQIEPNLIANMGEAGLVHIIRAPLMNAIQFSSPGSQVIFTAVSADNNIVLTTEDHGPGIDKATQDKLFQPFSRSATEQFNYEGMGLDLYLTRVILEQYGGTITLNSTVGEGTRVGVAINKGDSTNIKNS